MNHAVEIDTHEAPARLCQLIRPKKTNTRAPTIIPRSMEMVFRQAVVPKHPPQEVQREQSHVVGIPANRMVSEVATRGLSHRNNAD